MTLHACRWWAQARVQSSSTGSPKGRTTCRSGVALAAVLAACTTVSSQPDAGQDPFTRARDRMVEQQIAARGVRRPDVLAAIREVPRHLFVPPAQAQLAYNDHPLPIGYGQTISQPYIVAVMTELADPKPTNRAFEVGTGSGYQAAVLSRLVDHVYTIEVVEPLASEARERLARLGYRNVTVRYGDGYQGWQEHAPFDVMLVTAAPETVPPALIEQLRVGGRMVIPVGPQGAIQELRVIEKRADGTTSSRVVEAVRFVPMIRTP